MGVAIVLALVGLFLIYLEFFLPGGVMGVGGGLLIFAGIFFLVMKKPAVVELVFYIIGVIAALFFVVKIALWHVKKSRSRGTIYLDTDQEGFIASLYQKELIGKAGIAASDLKPSGHILVEEKYLQATSKSGYIEKGDTIVVVGGEGSHLVVKHKSKEDKS